MKEREKSKPKGYLTTDGEKLRAEVREGSLSSEDRRRLVESKDALLQLLTLKPGAWEFQILPGEIEDYAKNGETACEQRNEPDEN